MPEMSGLKLQAELSKAEVHVPVVFLTAHGDVEMAVAAMKAGAVDFLVKPFRTQDLLDAVFTALEHDHARRALQELISTSLECFNALSVREKEVLSHVAVGRLNKQIAAELGVSEVMVKVHRAHGMRKMHAKSVAELVRMTDLLNHAAARKPSGDGLHFVQSARIFRPPDRGRSDALNPCRRIPIGDLQHRRGRLGSNEDQV